MRTWLLPLVLSLTASSAVAHAAGKASGTDKRQGFLPGTSRTVGRALARQIKIMKQAPVGEQSTNPGVALQGAVREMFATGSLTNAAGEDGAVMAEVTSFADAYGKPRMRVSQIVMGPVQHGADGILVATAIDHATTSRHGGAIHDDSESHGFQVEQSQGLARRKRTKGVRFHPTSEIVSTTERLTLDDHESGHNQTTTHMAAGPRAQLATTHTTSTIVDMGIERPNFGVADQLFIGPARTGR